MSEERRNGVGRTLQSDESPTNSGPVAAIHRRRKSATLQVLGIFENEIEPLLPPGSQDKINRFKGVCREKINGIAYEGIRAAQAQPGDSVGDLATDFAERLAFTDPEAD